MVQSLPGRDRVVSTVLPKAEVNLAHPAADPLRSSSLSLRQKRKFENSFKLIWSSGLVVSDISEVKALVFDQQRKQSGQRVRLRSNYFFLTSETNLLRISGMDARNSACFGS